MDETKIYKLGSVAGPVILANYTVNQRPYWAYPKYSHSVGTRGQQGVEKCRLCLQDSFSSAK